MDKSLLSGVKGRIERMACPLSERMIELARADMTRREQQKTERNEYSLLDVHKELLSLPRFPGALSEFSLAKEGNYEILDITGRMEKVLITNFVNVGFVDCHPELFQSNQMRGWGLRYQDWLAQGLCGFVYWSGWRDFEWKQRWREGEGLPIKKSD